MEHLNQLISNSFDRTKTQAIELAHDTDPSDPISAYIYDLSTLQAHARWMKSYLPKNGHIQLYYAVKANSEPRILQTLVPIVDGFEVASGGEIQRLLADGSHVAQKPFIFAGPGKVDNELKLALENNVEFIHVEGLNEIHRLAKIAKAMEKKQKVLIRVNPELSMYTMPDGTTTSLSYTWMGMQTPFGIDEIQLIEAAKLLTEQYPDCLELCGFHVHTLTSKVSWNSHSKLIEWLLEKWSSWLNLVDDASREKLQYLNLGGGLEVNYTNCTDQYDWPALIRWLECKLDRLEEAKKPKFVRFEIGRYMTAFCGHYATQIIDIKSVYDQNFIICRGGIQHFRLAARTGDGKHVIVHVPLYNTKKSDQAQEEWQKFKKYTVVGQLCTPSDTFAKDVKFPKAPEVGDLLILPMAGAYAQNIAHVNFLSHPKPKVVFLE